MRQIVTFISIFFIGISFVNSQKTGTPKLMVGIVIDQMCYEYLYRYETKFSKNGFNKLLNNGVNCKNVQYNYVPTYTGPGHASIYTGTTPNNHGIVGNEWYDRKLGKTVNCVHDTTVFGLLNDSHESACSPKKLKVNTITDQLKLTYPAAKIISMSIKDRSAILPGGHLSNGSYWFDYISGKFTSSNFYMQSLPFWVQNFNEKNLPEKYLNETWTTLLDVKEYTESEPDDSPYEQLLPGKKSPVFPYNLKEMCDGKPNFNLFTSTPFANTYLTDFALSSINNEMLGQDNQTDFLCISYSTPDIVGHTFGPYSVEMEDVYLRLDIEIARLIKGLEDKVGKNEFILFLTSDHAVVPVPQYLIDKKLPGGYLFLENNLLKLSSDIRNEFGVDLFLAEENNNIYLDHETMDLLKINKVNVEDFVARQIEKWEGVKTVYTSKDLLNSTNDNSWKDMISKGFISERSGDVIFMLEPGFLTKNVETEKSRKGTSHGSPFNYDTHVPLIWYGKNIPKREVYRRINIVDITATLVHFLKVQKPNSTTGEPILEVLEK